MSRRTITILQLLTAAFHLYPREYRRQYEEEMLSFYTLMLHDAHSRREYAGVGIVLVKDFIKSVIRQHSIAITQRLAQKPHYLKIGTLFSIFLLTPYIFVCGYNLVAKNLLHRRTLLLQWEAHTWMYYCVLLPVCAFITITIVAVMRVYSAMTYGSSSIKVSEFAEDALLIGIPLTLLTTVALL
jgi:hypothetical protein